MFHFRFLPVQFLNYSFIPFPPSPPLIVDSCPPFTVWPDSQGDCLVDLLVSGPVFPKYTKQITKGNMCPKILSCGVRDDPLTYHKAALIKQSGKPLAHILALSTLLLNLNGLVPLVTDHTRTRSIKRQNPIWTHHEHIMPFKSISNTPQ